MLMASFGEKIPNELVDFHPDVILAGVLAAAALRVVDSFSIPDRIVKVADRVAAGFVTNLARLEATLLARPILNFRSVGVGCSSANRGPSVRQIAMLLDLVLRHGLHIFATIQAVVSLLQQVNAIKCVMLPKTKKQTQIAYPHASHMALTTKISARCYYWTLGPNYCRRSTPPSRLQLYPHPFLRRMEASISDGGEVLPRLKKV